MIPVRRKPILHGMRSNVIAIDVDGTLVIRGQLNTALVEWCEQTKADGKSLMLWSARGTEYARQAAERFGIIHLFDVIIGKPEAIVDDKGWSWIKFTRVVRSLGAGENDAGDQADTAAGDDADDSFANSEDDFNLNL